MSKKINCLIQKYNLFKRQITKNTEYIIVLLVKNKCYKKTTVNLFISCYKNF